MQPTKLVTYALNIKFCECMFAHIMVYFTTGDTNAIRLAFEMANCDLFLTVSLIICLLCVSNNYILLELMYSGCVLLFHSQTRKENSS